MPDFLVDGPADAASSFVFAHGAGAPMDHPWMETVATGIAAAGVLVVRFEFSYMAQRRTTGKRPGPNPAKALEQTWREAIEGAGEAGTLVIGGKSMGGRIASMVADDAGVRGLVCLGYPFHPAGKPDRLRTEHLASLTTPALIVQGERDTMGRREEVARYKLSKAIRLLWMPDGDHGFKPRKASGRSEEQNLREAITAVVEFIGALAQLVGPRSVDVGDPRQHLLFEVADRALNLLAGDEAVVLPLEDPLRRGVLEQPLHLARDGIDGADEQRALLELLRHEIMNFVSASSMPENTEARQSRASIAMLCWRSELSPRTPVLILACYYRQGTARLQDHMTDQYRGHGWLG